MSRSPRVVVVGSANVDLTTFTDQFPRPGETIFGKDFHLGFGGKGANQAFAARRCGAEVTMIARIGDDLFGQATLDNFVSAGIETRHVLITPGVSSGVAPIFVDSAGQNRILVVKGANDRLSPSDVDAAADVIREADFVIAQLEIPLATVFHTLELARSLGVRPMLNPAPGHVLDFDRLKAADFVIPNETEAETMTGLPMSDSAEVDACARFLLDKGLRQVIITLGANGSLHAAPQKITQVPAFEVTAVDSTGAGDAFIGSLACFLAEGRSESDAMSRANLYAALSTLTIGTQKSFVTRDRFEAEWAKRS
ncbi:MAG: ribokinase [Bryobacterales bacterium]|nr:ribokinase [Bryobacterales bacterium]